MHQKKKKKENQIKIINHKNIFVIQRVKIIKKTDFLDCKYMK